MLGYGRRITMALGVGAAAITALATPTLAGAAQTLGQTFSPDEASNCGDITWLQTASPGGQYTVPSAGVITSWTFHASAAETPVVIFKVARPTGGGTYSIIGESGVKLPPSGVATTYTDIRIPVLGGDVIGFYIGPPQSNNCGRDVPRSTYGYVGESGNQDQAAATAFDDYVGIWFQFDVSAGLEPDADCDGFGDETQDSSIEPSGCNPPATPQPEPQPEPESQPKADGTLTLDANKGKVEKGRKVTLSGQVDVPSNESCEPGRQIQIQRRLNSEDDSKFATFETVQTDATGNYTLKVKVTKTYFYRAVIGETETCDDETSSSQKVRVQKKKAAQEA